MALQTLPHQTPISDIRSKLEAALSTIQVPELGGNVIALGWLKEVLYKGPKLALNIVLPTYALAREKEIISEIKTVAITSLFEKSEVEVNVYSEVQPVFKKSHFNPKVANVKNVILVASGKGGVGKSTVASNLAQSLAQMGAQVGLMDADVYGPSIPMMYGIDKESQIEGFKLEGDETTYMIPKKNHGVHLMSLGFLVDAESPMVWRGPMIANAAMQMFYQVAWGDLDYLIVDLPPGTGDIQLSISQKVVVAGAILVSTPQDIALADVRRGKGMFDKVHIPTIGLVENMSYFICDGCDKKHHIFASNGAKKAAKDLGVPFFGEIPLIESIRSGSDEGIPAVADAKHPEIKASFDHIAHELALTLIQMVKDAPQLKQAVGFEAPPPASSPKKKGLPVLN